MKSPPEQIEDTYRALWYGAQTLLKKCEMDGVALLAEKENAVRANYENSERLED